MPMSAQSQHSPFSAPSNSMLMSKLLHSEQNKMIVQNDGRNSCSGTRSSMAELLIIALNNEIGICKCNILTIYIC